MLGAVDAKNGKIGTPGHPQVANAEVRRLACGGEGEHRRDRSRVVDVTRPVGIDAEHLPQPVERTILELRRRRRRLPEHRVHVQRRRQQLGEDSGRTGADREVGEEAGVIPVSDPRNDHALEVGNDVIERLARARRRRRERGRDLARSRARDHGKALRMREILAHPLDETLPVVDEALGWDVAREG